MGDNEIEQFWHVQAVFGCPEDPGPGFGYTVGLATRGLHELHMWDRPTHGDDPGADFKLSSRDICSILNEFAAEWVAEQLQPGDVREVSLDGGLTSAHVIVGEALPAEQLDAWRAMPSLVVPLRWSLERPARGARVPIPAGDRAGYEAELEEVAGLCRESIAVDGGYRPGQRMTFRVGGRYGPLTTLVVAHARAMAGTRRLGLLLDNAVSAESAIVPSALTGEMATLSRLSGRDEQIHAVGELALRATARLQRRRDWREMAARMSADAGRPEADFDANVADLVGTMFRSALVGIALADVLPEDMLLASQGPWRALISEHGDDPGEHWRCSDRAEATVRDAFANLTPRGCTQVTHALDGPLFEVVDSESVSRAVGVAITGPFSPPPVVDVVPATCRFVASFPLVHRDLTMAARLIVAVVDGSLSLEPAQVREVSDLLGLPIDLDRSRAA